MSTRRDWEYAEAVVMYQFIIIKVTSEETTQMEGQISQTSSLKDREQFLASVD